MNESVLAGPDGQTGSTRSSWYHSPAGETPTSLSLALQAPVILTGLGLTGLSSSITPFPLCSGPLPAPGPAGASGTLQNQRGCTQGPAPRASCPPGASVLQQGRVQGTLSAPGCCGEHSSAVFAVPVLGQWKILDILPRLQLEQLGFGISGHRGSGDVWLPLLSPVVRICHGVTAVPLTAGTQQPCPALPVHNATPQVCASPWAGIALCQGPCRG